METRGITPKNALKNQTKNVTDAVRLDIFPEIVQTVKYQRHMVVEVVTLILAHVTRVEEVVTFHVTVEKEVEIVLVPDAIDVVYLAILPVIAKARTKNVTIVGVAVI